MCDQMKDSNVKHMKKGLKRDQNLISLISSVKEIDLSKLGTCTILCMVAALIKLLVNSDKIVIRHVES